MLYVKIALWSMRANCQRNTAERSTVLKYGRNMNWSNCAQIAWKRRILETLYESWFVKSDSFARRFLKLWSQCRLNAMGSGAKLPQSGVNLLQSGVRLLQSEKLQNNLRNGYLERSMRIGQILRAGGDIAFASEDCIYWSVQNQWAHRHGTVLAPTLDLTTPNVLVLNGYSKYASMTICI